MFYRRVFAKNRSGYWKCRCWWHHVEWDLTKKNNHGIEDGRWWHIHTTKMIYSLNFLLLRRCGSPIQQTVPMMSPPSIDVSCHRMASYCCHCLWSFWLIQAEDHHVCKNSIEIRFENYTVQIRVVYVWSNIGEKVVEKQEELQEIWGGLLFADMEKLNVATTFCAWLVGKVC